jgi:hypothetical protein
MYVLPSPTSSTDATAAAGESDGELFNYGDDSSDDGLVGGDADGRSSTSSELEAVARGRSSSLAGALSPRPSAVPLRAAVPQQPLATTVRPSRGNANGLFRRFRFVLLMDEVMLATAVSIVTCVGATVVSAAVLESEPGRPVSGAVRRRACHVPATCLPRACRHLTGCCVHAVSQTVEALLSSSRTWTAQSRSRWWPSRSSAASSCCRGRGWWSPSCTAACHPSHSTD